MLLCQQKNVHFVRMLSAALLTQRSLCAHFVGSSNIAHTHKKGDALAADIMWFSPVAVRATEVRKVVGGWSRMLRDYLVLQLTSAEGGLQTSGVPLVLAGSSGLAGSAVPLGSGGETSGVPLGSSGDQQCLLFARLAMLLSDGDGLRLGLEWMGQGCLKPCWRHLNVLKKGSDLAVSNPEYVEITCSDSTKFKSWEEQDFRGAIDLLVEAHGRHQRGELNATRLDDLQKVFGFRATADGLLASAKLRPLVRFQDVLRYDWVHTFLADGVLTSEAWMVVDAAVRIGVSTQTDVHMFLKEEWGVPQYRRLQGRELSRIFNSYGARANESHNTIKCSSSELLTLYGLLRHFAEVRLPQGDERLSGQLQCFYMACKLVDILMAAKRRVISTADAGAQLRTALEQYLAVHVRLHGESRVKPKSHWAFDIVEQLLQDKMLFDCFAIERLHLRIRHHSENVTNLRTFERSVLSGVVNEHARKAQSALPGCGLVGQTFHPPSNPDMAISDRMDVGGMRISVDDFVAHGHRVGRVVACCVEDQDLFVIVDLWRRVSDLSQHSAKWAQSGSRAVWRAVNLMEVLAWQSGSDGAMTIVIM